MMFTDAKDIEDYLIRERDCFEQLADIFLRVRLRGPPRQRLPLRNYLRQFASVILYAVFFRSVFSAPPHATS